MMASAAGAARRRFTVAGPVDGTKHYSVDRSPFHAKLAGALLKGRCMLLHGHRQDGKSSAAGQVATILEENPNWVTLSLTFEGLSSQTEAGAWAAFELLVRCAACALAVRLAARGTSLPPAVMQAQAHDPPLFTDVPSFQYYWRLQNWDSFRVALFIDEIDALLAAPGAVRASILSGLRATRTQLGISAEGPLGDEAGGVALPIHALCAILAIGVYKVLRLSDGTDALASPFNVADSVQPPLATFAGISAMISEYDSDNDVTTPLDIVNDIVWRSGGHVGLASFLCSALAELPNRSNVTATVWWALMASPALLTSLQESATVHSMLRCVELGPECTSVTISARALVRQLLIVPNWGVLPLGAVSMDAASVLLLSEGIMIRVDSVASHGPELASTGSAGGAGGSSPLASSSASAAGISASADSKLAAVVSGDVISVPLVMAPTQGYRISAPLLAQQLLLAVGSLSQFFSDALPSLRFSTLSQIDTRLNLVKTVVECLPFFYGEGLSHPLGLLKDMTPCEFAYHAPLYTILRARGNSQNVCVIFEAREPGKKKLRRLDIALVDGTRAGIELLVNSNDLEGHVEEQAPTYASEQSLANVLVVNFCSAKDMMNLSFRVSRSAADKGVELMHLLYDSVRRTMTPFTFDSLAAAFHPSEPIPLLDSDEAVDGSRLDSLRYYEERAVLRATTARESAARGSAADVSALTALVKVAEAGRSAAEAGRSAAEAVIVKLEAQVAGLSGSKRKAGETMSSEGNTASVTAAGAPPADAVLAGAAGLFQVGTAANEGRDPPASPAPRSS